MTYRGRIQNGVVVFDEPIDLPDGTEVQVLLSEPHAQDEEEGEVPTLYERLKPFIGKAQDLPPDASINIDHYLYGAPRK